MATRHSTCCVDCICALAAGPVHAIVPTVVVLSRFTMTNVVIMAWRGWSAPPSPTSPPPPPPFALDLTPAPSESFPVAQGLTLVASLTLPTSTGAKLVAADSAEVFTSVLGQTTTRSVLVWSSLHFLLQPAPHLSFTLTLSVGPRLTPCAACLLDQECADMLYIVMLSGK